MFGRRLAQAAEASAAALFFAMFALFVAGVAMRYLAAAPLAWADELIMVIFIWLIFTTEALVIEEREQVSFDAVYDMASERGRRAIGILGAMVLAGLFIASLPTVLDYVRFLWREKTNVLQWRLDLVYSCIIVFWCAVIVRAAVKLARLAGAGWRRAVARTPPDERAGLLG